MRNKLSEMKRWFEDQAWFECTCTVTGIPPQKEAKESNTYISCTSYKGLIKIHK